MAETAMNEQLSGYMAPIQPKPAMQSPEINELACALAKAQSVITGATKDAKNPFFKSNYADLSAVWSACREALSANELAVIQTTEPVDTDGTAINLRTTLAHSSGQWVASVYPVVPQKDDPQGWGSALTYARRYSLAAIAGVAPKGDDDDGEAAMQRTASTNNAPKRETEKDLWAGPLNKTAFKKALMAFTTDVESCADYDSIRVLLNASQDLLTQCQTDMPSWWYGQEGSDVIGLNERIEGRKAQLSLEADSTMLGGA